MRLVKKVAIVSESMTLQHRITKFIRNRVDFDLEIFDHVDELMEYKYLNSVHSIVIATDRFDASHLDILLHLNNELQQIPIVLVAKEVSNRYRSLFGLAKANKCLILEEKYELVDLTTILDRMTRGETVVNREFVRYPVDVSIKARRKNGSFLTCRVVNLSLGGAQLKTPKVNFKKGETLSLDFPKHSEVKAVVSWHNKGRGLIGVQFVKVNKKNQNKSA